MQLVFWISVLVLWYIYDGYLRLLRLLCIRRDAKRQVFPRLAPDVLPNVTVVLTVHDEEQHIARRLENLLAQDYPKEKLQIIVVSDGSTDGTNSIVQEYAKAHPVQLIASDRLGKSGAQNKAIPEATGDIVILTDAETRFAPNCLQEIVAPFADAGIGCVTGRVLFETSPGILARGQGFYWAYEWKLRERESRLGWLAVASGNIMALRKSLFRPLPLNVGDDCIIPLDVVVAGYRVIHQEKALAYDMLESEGRREFNSRVRMTVRNWTGMWLRPALLDPRRHPGYAFALWSHKLLRWLGAVFLLLLALSSAILAARLYLPAWAVLAFLALALAGRLKEHGGPGLPGAGLAYGFCVANLGFLIGLYKALRGQAITHYRAGY